MKQLFILLAFGFEAACASSLCKNYEVPKSYSLMRADVQSAIEKFAENKIIAESADNTLSKLITSKSPMISLWYKKGNFAGKSELEIAKEWRKHYSHNFLLMSYPQDEKINIEIEKMVDEKLLKYFTNDYKKRLEGLFDKSKDLAIQSIIEMNIPQGKLIIDRIRSIKLYWPMHLKTSRNNSIPLDLLEWGVAYDPVPNEINIGLNSILYSSDENYMAVFTHEIGHSFDSCRWGAFFEGAWPFEKVGECLRSEKSVAAKKRDDSKLDEYVKSGKISPELVMALKANPTCNKLAYPTRGTQADQLPETFADWFSAEAVSHLKNFDVAKLRLDLCEEKMLINGSSYVSNQLRQEKIYFSHPKISKLLLNYSNSLSLAEYCSM